MRYRLNYALFGDMGHWTRVWPGLTFQGHSKSKKTVPNETSYMTSYMWLIPYLAQFSRYRPKQCYHGVKKQIWLPCRHFWNRTENKWAHMLALLSFLSAPSLKEIQLVVVRVTAPSVCSKCAPSARPPFWMISKIYLTCIILRPLYTWSWCKVSNYLIHTLLRNRCTYVRAYVRPSGRTDVCTDGRSPNYKSPNPSGWGLITENSIPRQRLFQHRVQRRFN